MTRLITYWNCPVFADDNSPTNVIDQKNRGTNVSQKGEIPWCIDSVEHNFADGK